MSTMPPGWYDDTRGALRWWDGRQWTEHVAVPDPEGSDDDDRDTDLPFELSELGERDESSESSGAFVAATEPRGSKLWIVWVVLGVVLLGVVIAAAVLIPLMFLSLTTSADTASSQTEAQSDAVEAVHEYNEAWLEADCDDYMQVTTEAFRQFEQIIDCSDFTESAQFFGDSVENYVVSVTAIDDAGATITVSTRESYDSFIDVSGEVLDTPEPFQDSFDYVLVPAGDEWAIDRLGR